MLNLSFIVSLNNISKLIDRAIYKYIRPCLKVSIEKLKVAKGRSNLFPS